MFAKRFINTVDGTPGKPWVRWAILGLCTGGAVAMILIVVGMLRVASIFSFDNFNSAEHTRLSPRVWLHFNGGPAAVVTDEEGFGLVNGDVTRAGYDGNDKNLFIVVYKPHVWDATGSKQPVALKTAKIDLSTAAVTQLSGPIAEDDPRLTDVNTFRGK